MKEEEKTIIGVIEQDESIRGIVTNILKELGYDTVSACLTEIQKDLFGFSRLILYNPQVILMDIPRPYKENMEFFYQLSAMEECKMVRFILMTTDPEKIVKSVAKERGIGYIAKPFEIDELEGELIKSLEIPKEG